MTTLIGGRLAGREPTEDDVEPLTWSLWERARGRTRSASCSRRPARGARPLDHRLPRPLRHRPHPGAGSATLADRRGPRAGDQIPGALPALGAFTPYTAIVNVTGQPAISLPLYLGPDGLPTAVQLVGSPTREDVLLALATQLEAAAPWPATARR